MPDQPNPLEAIATDAYIYFYPLVTMELTRLQATNAEAGSSGMRGPMNQFVHIRQFPDAKFRMVVRPNFDTLYSAAFLDLTREPVIVTAPDTDGRYYMLPMMDMWTDVFATPGQRATGTGAGSWAVTPPGWVGELPAGVDAIPSPTPYVWIIGRTQTNGPGDYEAVHAVQDSFALSLLSEWGQAPSPVVATVDPTIDMKTPPPEQVNAMSGAAYFTLAAELLKLHPPHLSDWSTLARFRQIGIVAGESFDADAISADVAAAVAAAPQAAGAAILAQAPTMAARVNGWQMNTNSIGVYGNFYAKRALVTMIGLGANPPEDAIYPLLLTDADGDKVDGGRDYVLHFEESELPPVDAFWSLTMYDDQGYQVANELDRFALGDRDPWVYGADGSLDLYLQPTNPGPDREPNWLPSPAGPVGVTLRLYGPRPEALTGVWAPPALRKAP